MWNFWGNLLPVQMEHSHLHAQTVLWLLTISEKITSDKVVNLQFIKHDWVFKYVLHWPNKLINL